MYQQHWGLDVSPYRDGVDPKFYHRGPVHEEALARMHFLVENGRRLGLLVGTAGTGKSSTLEILAADLRRTGTPVAKVDLLGIDSRELIWQIATAWRTTALPGESEAVLWRRLADRITEFRMQKIGCVALFDNADEAAPEVLEQIARVVQCDCTSESPLTAILSARPNRLEVLGGRLLDLAMLRVDLTAWEPTDTIEFLQEALHQAGRDEPAFDDEAMQRLHELASGIPRRAGQLATLSLVAGAGAQLDRVDRETVEAVYEELGVM